MKYQKIIKLLDETKNQLCEFRTKYWVQTNDEGRRTYNAGNEIKFKTSMIRSNLFNYSDVYIHAKGTTTVPNTSEKRAASDDRNRKVIFKSCALCTIWLSEINNTQVDDAHDIDIVIPTHDSIEYSDTYSKTLGHL